jgi:hypothetical protein
MPKAYEFKINISLDKLVNLLKIRRYIIENQVLNYNNKVVAVIVRKEDNERDTGIHTVLSISTNVGIIRIYMDR